MLYNTQVGCKDYKTALVYSDYFNVTAAAGTLVAGDNGLAVVEHFPVKTVPANRKMYLLAVNGQFFSEMNKQICHKKSFNYIFSK